MDAKLVIVGGKASKGPISLKLPTIIGRSRQSDLTVAHPMISRQHCKLFEVDGLLKIQDLGSLNGTFVGQEKVTEADLLPQTQFTVGPLTFRVEYQYTAPPKVAPPEPANIAPPADAEPSAEPAPKAEPQTPDIITMDAAPDFLAAAAPGDVMAPAEVDPAPESSSAATQSPDFSDLGLGGMDQAETEPQPASAQAGQPSAEPAQEATGPAEEETVTELPFEVAPVANRPATPTAAEEKKGWWPRGKGKKPAAESKKPAAGKTASKAKTPPAAKPAAGAAAPAKPAETPPPGEDEMPDFLANAQSDAGPASKPADPEDDILGFLQ